MRVLIVKTSSMGDVVHTLPALTDAAKNIQGIVFDWVVEESFKDIPAMHPNVDKVIAVNIRRWRKNAWQHRAAIQSSIKQIRQTHYDCVIDAQGLIKSAVLTRLVKAKRFGLDKSSAREGLSALAYTNPIQVSKGQHAITRVRELFAKSLGYSMDTSALDYGLKQEVFPVLDSMNDPYVVFLHGTTWASKHWPEEYWVDLISLAKKHGLTVYLPWGNEIEQQRAEKAVSGVENAIVLPLLSIANLASVLMHAKGVVGVDSGLAHLSAACGTPTVTLYGSTNSVLTGTMGENNICLQSEYSCSPCMNVDCHYAYPSEIKPACYQKLTPLRVWKNLLKLM